MPRESDRFYSDIATFDAFEKVSDPSLFRPVPDDWHVIVADIRGSTKLTAAGQYKQVNMIGASSIIAALNAVKGVDGALDVPYVFGGDGATMAVPDTVVGPVVDALCGAAVLARREFALDLRIGTVPVRVLRDRGRDVTVAKLLLSPGNELAVFSGGGVQLADHLIKSDRDGANGFAVDADRSAAEPDMTGLSCRWEPLLAQRGVILCLMAQAMHPDRVREIYDTLIARIERAVGGDFRLASPVTPQTMRFKWIPKGLRMEARITRGRTPYWRRFLALSWQSLIQFFLEKLNLSAGGYDAPVYREELLQNSDYRRFDDVLRLVLDCTHEQVDAVIGVLEDAHSLGLIAYGYHASDHALMTCLLFDLEQSEHVHFIDGGNGGFTLASVGFKRQLRDMMSSD